MRPNDHIIYIISYKYYLFIGRRMMLQKKTSEKSIKHEHSWSNFLIVAIFTSCVSGVLYQGTNTSVYITN